MHMDISIILIQQVLENLYKISLMEIFSSMAYSELWLQKAHLNPSERNYTVAAPKEDFPKFMTSEIVLIVIPIKVLCLQAVRKERSESLDNAWTASSVVSSNSTRSLAVSNLNS